MRLHTATTVAFFSSFLVASTCDPSFAQQWSVNLHNIRLEDPAGVHHRTRAESVEFMPDGRTLVTAGFFYNGVSKHAVGEVRLWDVADGSLKATLHGTAASYALRAGSLAVSSTGDRIAAAGRTADNEQIIDVFDAKNKQLVRTLKGDRSRISCVTFSPDGKILAAARWDKTVDLWNHAEGKPLNSFSPHSHGVTPIAFSPDGKLLATGNGDGSISFWDPKTTKNLGNIPAQAEIDLLGALVFSPDGKLVASGGFPRQPAGPFLGKRDVKILGEKAVKKLPPQLLKNKPRSLSPIYVWELTGLEEDNKQLAAKLKAKFKGHREYTYALAFSPDGRTLASANQDTTARVWDLVTNKHLATITAHADFVYDVVFSPDGKTLATLGRDSLHLWTMEQIKQKK